LSETIHGYRSVIDSSPFRENGGSALRKRFSRKKQPSIAEDLHPIELRAVNKSEIAEDAA
jgi:hypothetical protein